MLSSQDPTPGIEALLKSPFYTDRVTYIKGNPLSFPAMAKAKLETASACFLFQGQPTEEDVTQQDSVMVMQCLALRKYSENVCIYAEALRPESRFHLQHIAKEVVCIQEFLSGGPPSFFETNYTHTVSTHSPHCPKYSLSWILDSHLPLDDLDF
jgi:hypothetical protein